jgi:hypothetical protein
MEGNRLIIQQLISGVYGRYSSEERFSLLRIEQITLGPKGRFGSLNGGSRSTLRSEINAEVEDPVVLVLWVSVANGKLVAYSQGPR